MVRNRLRAINHPPFLGNNIAQLYIGQGSPIWPKGKKTSAIGPHGLNPTSRHYLHHENGRNTILRVINPALELRGLASLYTDVLKLDCPGDTSDKAQGPSAGTCAWIQRIMPRGLGWWWEKVLVFKEEEAGEHATIRVLLEACGEQCGPQIREFNGLWWMWRTISAVCMPRTGMNIHRALLRWLSRRLDCRAFPASRRSSDRHSVCSEVHQLMPFLSVTGAPMKGKTQWKFVRADTVCCDGSVGTAVVYYANTHQWTL